jgi:hypothetical protein
LNPRYPFTGQLARSDAISCRPIPTNVVTCSSRLWFCCRVLFVLPGWTRLILVFRTLAKIRGIWRSVSDVEPRYINPLLDVVTPLSTHPPSAPSSPISSCRLRIQPLYPPCATRCSPKSRQSPPWVADPVRTPPHSQISSKDLFQLFPSSRYSLVQSTAAVRSQLGPSSGENSYC